MTRHRGPLLTDAEFVGRRGTPPRPGPAGELGEPRTRSSTRHRGRSTRHRGMSRTTRRGSEGMVEERGPGEDSETGGGKRGDSRRSPPTSVKTGTGGQRPTLHDSDTSRNR